MPTNTENAPLVFTTPEIGELAAVVAAMDAEGQPWATPKGKLAKAYNALVEGCVTPLYPEGLYTVLGAESKDGIRQHYTVDRDGCTCKANEFGKSRYACYHATAVALYQRWLQTQQAPLLTVPPTVEERLAQPPTQEEHSPVPEAMPIVMHEELTPEVEASLATVCDASALLIERVEEEHQHVSPMLPPVALPLGAEVLAQSLDDWSKQRAVIARYIRQHFVRDTDYGKIHIMSKDKCDKGRRCTNTWHWSKDVLFKPGAEKFLGLFRLIPHFAKDADTWSMLGSPSGVLCYVCTLQTHSGAIVGEGRGARNIKQDSNDLNKSIKMAEKSALLDAILRAGALSDTFTQDLEQEGDEEGHEEASPLMTPLQHPQNPRQEDKASPKALITHDEAKWYANEIRTCLEALGFRAATQEAYAAEIERRTGHKAHRQNYPDILKSLQVDIESLATPESTGRSVA